MHRTALGPKHVLGPPTLQSVHLAAPSSCAPSSHHSPHYSLSSRLLTRSSRSVTGPFAPLRTVFADLTQAFLEEKDKTDDLEFYYKDADGTVQGPFPQDRMHDWWSQGYLAPDLEISHHSTGVFAAINEYFTDGQMFVTPPTHQEMFAAADAAAADDAPAAVRPKSMVKGVLSQQGAAGMGEDVYTRPFEKPAPNLPTQALRGPANAEPDAEVHRGWLEKKKNRIIGKATTTRLFCILTRASLSCFKTEPDGQIIENPLARLGKAKKLSSSPKGGGGGGSSFFNRQASAERASGVLPAEVVDITSILSIVQQGKVKD